MNEGARPHGFRSTMSRIWRWIVAGPMTIYGVFALIRDEFLPDNLREQLRIGGLVGRALDQVHWYIWLIAGLVVLAVAPYLPRFRSLLKGRSRGPAQSDFSHSFSAEGIKLAPGHGISFPADNGQEYSFTVINESGVDITECYVMLDASARRMSEDDEWEIEQSKLIDRPFRWNKPGADDAGRLDIRDGDRASFTLGRSAHYPAANAQTKKSTTLYYFNLALHDPYEDAPSYELAIGYSYRLLISIRYRDPHGVRLPDVSYELYVKPLPSAGPAGGLEVLGIERVTHS